MTKRHSFKYRSLAAIREELEKLNLDLPLCEDLSVLKNGLEAGIRLNNRLAVHPMEGTDSNPDGTPGKLTRRRYLRFARGGASLLWFEAVAVNQQGRSNKYQLFLNKENAPSFSSLLKDIRKAAREKNGFEPYLVVQLTHAGRFGDNKTILFHQKELDQISGVEEELEVISDSELEQLADDYLNAARLAYEVGFDAVDIKSCHRYLLSEILAAHTREGKYGGSYENRTRFIKDVYRSVKKEVDIDLAIRMNITDLLPYPYGWGTDKDNRIDLNEPSKLVRELKEIGVKVFNITASTPYVKPHISRPYDKPGLNGYQPPEHPLVGVHRLTNLARHIQQEVEEAIVVGTGVSWLRQFAPYLAAGMVKEGYARVIGFGRESFAYPDFAIDILENNGFDKSRVCLTCGKCTDLKAAKKITGCVVRDNKIYLEPYQQLRQEGLKKGEEKGIK